MTLDVCAAASRGMRLTACGHCDLVCFVNKGNVMGKLGHLDDGAPADRCCVVCRRAAVILCVIGCLLAGCKADETRPDRPGLMAETTDVNGLLRYTLEQYKADKLVYDESIKAARVEPEAIKAGKQYEVARLYRDVMINRIRADIRDHSGEFEDNIRQKIAEWATGADFVELGLSAATTIVGGEQAKTVLAAILTAVKGGRISVDKNFFRERTSEAIISALRSTRLKQDAAIVEKMATLDVKQYTFEESWNDLVDLYYAGTLASGFQTLAEQAGAEATKAAEKRADVQKSRVELAAATPDEITLMGRLYAALSKMTEDQARAILTELQVAIPADDMPRIVLQQELRKLPPGDPRTPAFEAAYDSTLGKGAW